jgi:hypothetical protein
MNREQQELLLRMKLLMGYDNKKTLSENHNKLLNEQDPTLTAGGRKEPRKSLGKGSELKVPDSSDSSNLWEKMIFLNANPDKIAPGKPYNYLWNDFINRVKGANLEALYDTRTRALNDKRSYDLGISGGITPDLERFDESAYTGVATAVIDAQINALRKVQYEKDLNNWNTGNVNPYNNIRTDKITGKALLQPKPPKDPQFNLLNNSSVQINPNNALVRANTKNILTNLGAYNKTATQIKSEMESAEAKAKTDAELANCPLKTQKDGDNFRNWVNKNFKALAEKKEKDGGLELASTGKFCNSYINNAYKYVLTKADSESFYGRTLGQMWEFSKQFENRDLEREKLEKELYAKHGDSLQGQQFIKQQLAFYDSTKELKQELDKQVAYDEQAKKYECPFENVEEGNKFRLYVNAVYPELASKKVLDLGISGEHCNDYIKNAYKYILPKTYREAGKTLEELYNSFKSFQENQKMLDDFIMDMPTSRESTNTKYTLSQEQIDTFVKANENAKKLRDFENKEYYNNEEMWEIFGKQKLLNARKECPYKLTEFLEKIRSGEIYDENTGLKYGEYIMKNNKPYMVVWPADEPIPCDSEFMDSYGKLISLGAMVLSIALVIPSLGTSITFGASLGLRVFLSAAIDAGSSFVSAYYNDKAGRKEEAKMDIAIGLLSAFVEIPAISKVLTQGFDEFGEEALKRTFIDALTDNSTIKNYDDFKVWLNTLPKNKQKILMTVLDDKKVTQAISDFAVNGGINSPVKRIANAMEKTTKKVVGKGKGLVTIESILRNVGLKVPISLSPMAVHYGPKLWGLYFGTFQQIYGEDPDEQDVKIFQENIEKYFSGKSGDEIVDILLNDPEQLVQVMQNPDFVLQYINNQKIVVDGKEKNLQTIVSDGKNTLSKIDEEFERRQKEKGSSNNVAPEEKGSSSNVTPEEKNEVEELKAKIEGEREVEGTPEVEGEASDTEIK